MAAEWGLRCVTDIAGLSRASVRQIELCPPLVSPGHAPASDGAFSAQVR
jgi:hypothetical protein